ncbi:MAG: hypothetical protein MR006_04820 [Arcanobacterium sp.]|nr:hypothetical protein [Arcanobacterium sp.]
MMREGSQLHRPWYTRAAVWAVMAIVLLALLLSLCVAFVLAYRFFWHNRDYSQLAPKAGYARSAEGKNTPCEGSISCLKGFSSERSASENDGKTGGDPRKSAGDSAAPTAPRSAPVMQPGGSGGAGTRLGADRFLVTAFDLQQVNSADRVVRRKFLCAAVAVYNPSTAGGYLDSSQWVLTAPNGARFAPRVFATANDIFRRPVAAGATNRGELCFIAPDISGEYQLRFRPMPGSVERFSTWVLVRQ